MSVIYRLTKIEKDKGEVSVELSEDEMNVIYDCLNDFLDDESLMDIASDIQEKIYQVDTLDIASAFKNSFMVGGNDSLH